ncbi:MAG: FtsQ-type POTRA domain-containing protein [Spirochaetales bacterium]|uniref:FtsQ-type POTRA domain-containing protein n=1 Tax=Candidatus Thalassospirochaeta sargassi TaxID=3119039 RepID=A0AAJ1ML64_9SPIO|nr:FtsQ-type POTRA domain-containing protein [Spirochaetales bacterium]
MSQAYHFNNKEYNYSEPPFYGYNSVENNMVNAADRLEKDYRLRNKRERTAKIFKVIIAILLFVVFVQVFYHLYFARNVKVDKIQIETAAGFSASDEQILEMAGISTAESYFTVDENLIKARLERFPQISSAVVNKKFPDTLNISLQGRTPLAICLIESDGRIIPAAVDSGGVIFQLGKAVSNLNLPAVSGIRIDEARIGVKMPEAVTGFLEELDGLRRESPAFFNSISEIKIIRKSSDDFEVLMYPQNYSIPVRLGSKIDKELFTYVLLVLDVVKQQGMSAQLEELDFRTDEVVYRLREE